MILKTQGIVLKSFDIRETSRIAVFFTKDYGKVSGILKGIRKDPKKFGSHIDRFSVNDIVYYQSRNSDLHLVSQCDLRQFFFPVRQDLKKSLAASYILELVNIIMPSEEKNEKVYELMLNFLSTLGQAADINPLVYVFQIKTLLYSGFKPHLDTCLKCQERIEGTAKFSLREGGLICLDCPAPETDVHLVSRGTVASLLHIERNEWQNCLKLKFTEAAKKELKYILNNFLVFHLGRKVKSAKYLN
jgi:DNA repair protein RecO (recombination protein O)